MRTASPCSDLLAAVVVPLLVFVVAPLFEIFKMSFVTPDGIGLGNYVRYVNSPKFAKVVGNSLAVAATTTAITVLLAYAFAYAMRRTAMPLKNVFGSMALLAAVRAVAGAGAGHRVPLRA